MAHRRWRTCLSGSAHDADAVLHRHEHRRVIADPDNSLDWLLALPRSSTRSARFTAFFAEVGAMVMGSTTYQWILDHEDLLSDPERWHQDYGHTPWWVFTHRNLPQIPGAGITFVSGDPGVVHPQMLAAARGNNIWLVGGGDLVGQFVDRGLLDDVLLGVAPVFLGGGAPLLARRITQHLRLTGVERDDEFVLLSYVLDEHNRLLTADRSA